MKNKVILKGLGVFLFTLVMQSSALGAPACKGPNKNDPGCPQEPAPSAAVVDSVTVDWLGEKLTVRGSGFDVGVTSFLLGSGAMPLGPVTGSATEVYIPFDSVIALEVVSQGNYSLIVDGAVQLSVYIESQIVDPAAATCPCTTGWDAELGSLWGSHDTQCLEIEGPGVNDIADISGTVLTDPVDSSVYPHYAIGASFYPGDPHSSVCRLVQINGDASTTEWVNERINETQQENCAEVLKMNICTAP